MLKRCCFTNENEGLYIPMDTVPTVLRFLCFLGVNGGISGACRKFLFFSRHDDIEEYGDGEPVMDIVLRTFHNRCKLTFPQMRNSEQVKLVLFLLLLKYCCIFYLF